MTVQERIRRSLILKEMEKHKDEAKRLGLKDISRIKIAEKEKSTGETVMQQRRLQH